MQFRPSIRVIAPIAMIAMTVALSACNIYDPFDSPTSDAQLLSAARAYFDQGEFDKAAEMYAKISGSRADDAAADDAFRILDENGASMGNFMIAFGTGSGSMGKSFTKLANNMVNGAGQTKRLAILGAFQKLNTMHDPATMGVVRFVTAAALISELFAESAGTGTFDQNDIAADGATCAKINAATCAVAASCNAPTPDPWAYTSFNPLRLPTSGTTNVSGAKPNYYLISAALNEIDYALKNEILASGTFGTNLGGFVSKLAADFTTALGASQSCARYALLSQDVGSN